jgi:hypothetical protein
VTCETCKNWNLRGKTLEQRQMAQLKMGLCNLGPTWTFLPPHRTCDRHAPASAEICEARAKWLAKAK